MKWVGLVLGIVAGVEVVVGFLFWSDDEIARALGQWVGAVFSVLMAILLIA